VWQDYFRDWIARGNVLAASMYFDLRPAHGEPALAETLGGAARNDAKSNRRFLATMARDVVDRVLPLGWFGGVKAARSGPHRGCVDIKGAGGLQIVGAARVYALELGFADSNTEARIRAAAWHGLYSEAMAREIGDAYEDLLRLRLEHQLACLREGRPPDNYVDPWRLSHRDGVLLADALRAAASMQHALRERFATDFLS
jgi:CBS domain-containing protein